MKSIVILAITFFLLTLSPLYAWIPKPIKRPAQTIEKVMQIALNHSKKKNDNLKKTHDQFFVRSISYEEFDARKQPGHKLNEEQLKRLKGQPGWRVHILRSNDEAQLDVLYIDRSGKVIAYMQWQ